MPGLGDRKLQHRMVAMHVWYEMGGRELKSCDRLRTCRNGKCSASCGHRELRDGRHLLPCFEWQDQNPAQARLIRALDQSNRLEKQICCGLMLIQIERSIRMG